MVTNQLINALAADAYLPHPFIRVFCRATIFGIACAGFIFFAAIGPRLDLEVALHTWRFLLKFAITAPLAAVATTVIYRMAKPQLWQSSGLGIIAAPLCALVAAALFELFALPRSLWITRLIGSNSINCMTLIPLLAIGPLACFLAILRKAAPSDPGMTGGIAGLAAGSIAATFYALNCFDDSPLFVITWYPLAVGIVATSGYFLGRRVLVW
jgi:hypothetical protein